MQSRQSYSADQRLGNNRQSSDDHVITVSEDEVWRELKRVNVRKAARPVITGRVLRSCDQLAGLFTSIFNEFLATSVVPTSFKKPVIIPVPKNNDLCQLVECLGYVCNPHSLKEGTETSRRRTDELGYRLERPIHFECKLNEPMHIGMRLLHPAAADHSVSINRQQVQRIFRFSLRSRAGDRPLSGGTGAMATGRDVSVPSFRERGLHT